MTTNKPQHPASFYEQVSIQEAALKMEAAGITKMGAVALGGVGFLVGAAEVVSDIANHGAVGADAAKTGIIALGATVGYAIANRFQRKYQDILQQRRPTGQQG